MSSSKVKLRLKYNGQILPRKAVFFRPCQPNQIADAIRIICSLSSDASFQLLDEDGDVVAISDSLDPGVYEVTTNSFTSTNPSSSSSSSYTNTNSTNNNNNHNANNNQQSRSTRGRTTGTKTNATNDWDRRSNQVQREDIAKRSRAASSRAASDVAFDGLEYEFLFKFIIVGNMSVGKSCLLMRFADNQFKEHHQATIGVDFGSQVIQVGDSYIKIQIWDTAGQEDFRAITRAYYREACAALLVYDATNRKYRIVFVSLFLLYCLLFNHSFQTDPNSIYKKRRQEQCS